MSESNAEPPLTLQVVRLDPTSSWDDSIHCLACGEGLDVNQPDLADPDHLLGTCPACGSWHLLAWGEGEEAGLICRLPDWSALRKAAAPRS